MQNNRFIDWIVRNLVSFFTYVATLFGAETLNPAIYTDVQAIISMIFALIANFVVYLVQYNFQLQTTLKTQTIPIQSTQSKFDNIKDVNSEQV